MEQLESAGEVRLAYKPKIKVADRPQIGSSMAAYKLLKPLYAEIMEYREIFIVLYLNRANKVLGYHKISEGGMSGTVADAKMIFQGALLMNAQAIILSHNHPSGTATPSDNDRRLTSKAVEVGKLLDLPVLDHIILTEDNYLSFADDGILS